MHLCMLSLPLAMVEPFLGSESGHKTAQLKGLQQTLQHCMEQLLVLVLYKTLSVLSSLLEFLCLAHNWGLQAAHQQQLRC